MHQHRSSPPPPRGLLEKGWLTYLLLALVIILMVALYLSMQHQDEILHFFKGLLRPGQQKPVPPKAAHWEQPSFPTIATAIT